MNNLSLRITDHRTGFDQTIQVSPAAPELLPLHVGEITLRAIEPAGNELGPRFIVNDDGTVTDTVNRLMWSRENATDEPVDWDAAEAACTQLELGGHDDWRLPTRAELLTLIDDTRHKPAIDVNVFPSCDSGWYWTATPTAWASSCAWVVDFYDGDSYSSHRSSLGFVRAVRSLPAGQ